MKEFKAKLGCKSRHTETLFIMNDIQILSQAASAIQRAIAENGRLRNQSVALSSRVEMLEKQLKEHEEHMMVMRKNQLILAMNAEGTKEIGEELRKTIVTTLEEWSSELYQAEECDIDRSSCSDREYYVLRNSKNQDASHKRYLFIQMLEEVLTPAPKEQYLLNSDGTRVTDLDGKPVQNPDYTRPDRE